MSIGAGMAFDSTGSYIVTSSTNSITIVSIGASGSRAAFPGVEATLSPGGSHLYSGYDPVVDGNIAARGVFFGGR